MKNRASAKGNVVTEIFTLTEGPRPRPERARSRFLARHIVPSDNHGFVGRIFDLSIIGYHFDSYEKLAKHPDCKYAYDVNADLTALTQRVESLNLVGDMLWPEHLPENFMHFPVSRHQWLTLCADALLMRYISVLDCAIILTNAVYEAGLALKACTIGNLKNHQIPHHSLNLLTLILDDQGSLRSERNARFHHGTERGFTQDDTTFRSASLLEHRSGGVGGKDRFGRKINLDRFMREGLVELQRDFNKTSRKLIRRLDNLYDILWVEFENRFGPRIRSSTHGLRVSRRS